MMLNKILIRRFWVDVTLKACYFSVNNYSFFWLCSLNLGINVTKNWLRFKKTNMQTKARKFHIELFTFYISRSQTVTRHGIWKINYFEYFLFQFFSCVANCLIVSRLFSQIQGMFENFGCCIFRPANEWCTAHWLFGIYFSSFNLWSTGALEAATPPPPLLWLSQRAIAY